LLTNDGYTASTDQKYEPLAVAPIANKGAFMNTSSCIKMVKLIIIPFVNMLHKAVRHGE
jgi:hypothetical protein